MSYTPSPTSPLTGRNRIINGAFNIDQRNAGNSVTVNAGSVSYIMDRWKLNTNGSTVVLTGQQLSSTPPPGFINYFRTTVSTSGSLGSTDFYLIQQTIEALNIQDFAFGTVSAKNIIYSGWFRSSVAGTYGLVLTSNATTTRYIGSISIPVANVWTYVTIPIPGTALGTWNTSITFYISLGTGSTYQAPVGWNTNNTLGLSGSTTLITTGSATFDITGIQVEIGSNATSYEQRQIAQELILCQRYYWGLTTATNGAGMLTMLLGDSSTNCRGIITFPISLRVTPSLVNNTASNFSVSTNGSSIAVSSLSITDGTPQSVVIVVATGGGITGGACYSLLNNGSGTTTLAFDADF